MRYCIVVLSSTISAVFHLRGVAERKTEAPPTEGVNNQELMGKLTAPSAVASSAWFGDFICLNLQRILTTDLTDLTDKNAS